MTLPYLLNGTALVGSLFIMTPAWALEAQPDVLVQTSNVPRTQSPVSTTAPVPDDALPASEQAAAGDEANDIVVTGSRIPVRNTIDAAIPITSLSAAEVIGVRGDVSLGDALNQLPQLRATSSQANSTGFIGTAGVSLLDLRGLGAARTLVLVNGRRVVSAVPGAYTPDVSTIPFDLVERVDTVTGGQSAIYGSDAIAGVVNLVLKRDFEGTRLRAQGGATGYGDRGTYLVSGITGANFLDDKVNLTVSAEYSHAESVLFADRSYLGAYDGTPAFVTTQITTAPNRNFDGIPNTTFVPRGSKFANRSIGGTVITSCPIGATPANAAQRGLVCTGQSDPQGNPLSYFYNFQPDGSLLRDSPSTTGLTDNRAIGGGILFGGNATGVEGAQLLPSQNRFIANMLLTGNFSSAFKPFAEFQFAQVKVEQQSVQPSFTGGTLSASFSRTNPFLSPAATATLNQILPASQTSFTLNRFNNDLGTRAEFHTRKTYRGVIGVGGEIFSEGNIRYEIAGNYGRTENFYRTGGNVLVAEFNRAANAALAPTGFAGSNFVLNSQGQRVVCGVNANVATGNADPNCIPLNLFGQGQFDQRALNYVLHESTRNQWAEQINATAFVAGDLRGLFSLPAGPIGFSVGGEYRREDAQSRQDAITQSGRTFLNPAATFDPPAVEIKEVFGELRVPLVGGDFTLPLINELTFEAAGRISDYGGNTGSVNAWNLGGVWAPIRDLRFRASYSRSVRAPNLSNLFATASQTFQNGLTDPCDQPGGTNSSNNITSNPNRAQNCAAAGIPTTITFTDPASGVSLTRPWTNQPAGGVAGINQGNPDLLPEVGNSFTVGGTFAPLAVRGLAISVDYYNIRVKNVISGLTGQAIIDRCYDDPTGLDNPFCDAVFRRTSTDQIQNLTFNGQTNRTLGVTQFPFAVSGNGTGFLNQPFNFAQLRTRGIDFDVAYTKRLRDDLRLNARVLVSHIMNRQEYSYITQPDRFDRIDGRLGDPRWQGQVTLGGQFGILDLSYNARYVGKQIVSGLSYETFFPSQGRPALNPDARPFVNYDPVVYHNMRVGLNVTEKYRFYFGVDNISNELPPYELAGNENFTSGATSSIYPNVGRFFYAGAEFKF